MARYRIPVEHAICGMKIARIVHDAFRIRADGMNDASMVVAAGLYNFKCQCRDATPTK